VPSRLVLFDHTFIQTAPVYKVVRASAFHLHYDLTYSTKILPIQAAYRQAFPFYRSANRIRGMESGSINQPIAKSRLSLILKL
jgi:hypothetical protein